MKIDSLSKYIEEIKKIEPKEDEILLFRGHSDIKYKLIPGIFRDNNELKEESLCHDIMVDYSNEFNIKEHLSTLVKMQHYGSPTRLLDVTKNMLIALFFAVEDCKDGNDINNGEVIVFKIKKSDFLHHDSDKVLMLSCLPFLKIEDKRDLEKYCKDNKEHIIVDEDVAKKDSLKHLLHEIKREFPAFETCIETNHLLKNYFVAVKKDNERIQKQDGAFIIFGLGDKTIPTIETKHIKIDASDKNDILRDLKLCNIDSSTVYPSYERRLLMLNNKKLGSQSV
ncbi:MAG: FRG domain-containing protein [Clostridia bacterium]|nr:FRG domain-containing protein [Clostridia bacterium]